jgi:hypothetical protein
VNVSHTSQARGAPLSFVVYVLFPKPTNRTTHDQEKMKISSTAFQFFLYSALGAVTPTFGSLLRLDKGRMIAPSSECCCSTNLKDCDQTGWCGETQSRCEGSCNSFWIETNPSCEIALYQECTQMESECCSPATCQGNQYYKQCKLEMPLAMPSLAPSEMAASAPSKRTCNDPWTQLGGDIDRAREAEFGTSVSMSDRRTRRRFGRYLCRLCSGFQVRLASQRLDSAND